MKPEESVYRRLAALLDSLPHGFPRTESGVELRILEKIFTPEDAAFALKLRPIPEAPEAVARRLGMPLPELLDRLDGMVARGQIAALKIHGRLLYGLAPFVVGIWEFQLPRLDAELAELFEEYAPTLLATLGASRPALARVVPVDTRLDARAEVLAYSDLRAMLERGRSFRLMECICRKEAALLGRPCTHTVETCMAFSPEPDAYEARSLPEGFGRSITREEALEVLARCEQEGLVHCTFNVQRHQMFVCNCCDCCCGFLRGVKEFGAPHLLVRSDWVAAVDAEACADCGTCVERCPMDAVVAGEAGHRVDGGRCIGCGVCVLTCPSEAMSLRERPAAERTVPPKNLQSWVLRRAVSRSGPIKTLAQLGRIALGRW